VVASNFNSNSPALSYPCLSCYIYHPTRLSIWSQDIPWHICTTLPLSRLSVPPTSSFGGTLLSKQIIIDITLATLSDSLWKGHCTLL
jgi:hypothetical protein